MNRNSVLTYTPELVHARYAALPAGEIGGALPQAAMGTRVDEDFVAEEGVQRRALPKGRFSIGCFEQQQECVENRLRLH